MEGFYAEDLKALDSLLPAMNDGERMKPWQSQIITAAAKHGNLPLLRMLDAKRWKFSEELVSAGLESMDTASIEFLMKTSKAPFKSLCLPSSKVIVNGMKFSSPEQWAGLLKFGIGRMPICAEKSPGKKEEIDTLELVAASLICDPFAATGTWKTMLPQRFSELLQAGMPYSPTNEALRRRLKSCTSLFLAYANPSLYSDELRPSKEEDPPLPAVLRPLAKALQLEGVAFDDVPLPPPDADKKWLAGRYSGDGNLGTLLLKPDGEFTWIGYQSRARGRWTAEKNAPDGGILKFASDNNSAASLRVAETTQYPEGHRGPMLVTVTIRLEGAGEFQDTWVYFFDANSLVKSARVTFNKPIELEFDRMPTKMAFWKYGMQDMYSLANARMALEVDIPPRKNIQTLVLEVDVKPEGLWAPFAKTLSYSDQDRTGIGSPDKNEIYLRPAETGCGMHSGPGCR